MPQRVTSSLLDRHDAGDVWGFVWFHAASERGGQTFDCLALGSCLYGSFHEIHMIIGLTFCFACRLFASRQRVHDNVDPNGRRLLGHVGARSAGRR